MRAGRLLCIAGAGASCAQAVRQHAALQGSEATPAELRGGWLEVPVNTLVPGRDLARPKIKIPAERPGGGAARA